MYIQSKEARQECHTRVTIKDYKFLPTFGKLIPT